MQDTAIPGQQLEVATGGVATLGNCLEYGSNLYNIAGHLQYLVFARMTTTGWAVLRACTAQHLLKKLLLSVSASTLFRCNRDILPGTCAGAACVGFNPGSSSPTARGEQVLETTSVQKKDRIFMEAQVCTTRFPYLALKRHSRCNSLPLGLKSFVYIPDPC